MNFQKQIQYWEESSQSDIETAEILVEKNKIREGLFFCHLAVEKILKALYIKRKPELAPKSHNLFMLCELSGISLNEKQEFFFGILMNYQIHGRYPETIKLNFDKTTIDQYLRDSREVLAWLRQML